MEWFFWMVGIWFVMNLMGRGACSVGRWNAHDRRRLRATRSGHGARDAALRPRRTAQLRRPAPPKPERKETPEERIRRRFVEGRIDLDRYEAELWEELRPK